MESYRYQLMQESLLGECAGLINNNERSEYVSLM